MYIIQSYKPYYYFAINAENTIIKKKTLSDRNRKEGAGKIIIREITITRICFSC